MQRDDRARFNRRGMLTTIVIGVLVAVFCLGGLLRVSHRHYPQPARCLTYGPSGCTSVAFKP